MLTRQRIAARVRNNRISAVSIWPCVDTDAMLTASYAYREMASEAMTESGEVAVSGAAIPAFWQWQNDRRLAGPTFWQCQHSGNV